jgi:tRNA1(Val) A37 N6-methylase TrmN6
MMRDDFVLQPGEELHHLIEGQLFILQVQEHFRFGIDAVLLANWVKIRRGDTVIDLGTGTGVIPLLITYKQNPERVVGVEIQEEMAALAQRSVELNQLEERIQIVHRDLRQIRQFFPANSFSLVVSNPPYFPVGSGERNLIDKKAVARHEVNCSLQNLVGAAAYLLGTRGRFDLIHRVERIPEIFQELQAKGLEPKVMRLIQSRAGQEPNLVLIEAVKDARPGLKIERHLVIYEPSGEYTDEVKEMYFGYGKR